jgi:hypothetical protein
VAPLAACSLALLLFLTAAGSACAAVRYVDANSASPAAPYTNWAAAAATIQDAVDAAEPGDDIVVTDGTYATGGRALYGTMTNRVAVYKPVALRSVNGPELTLIGGYQVPGTTNGDGAIRCVYLTNGASLSGFTLTNGATRSAGNQAREQSGGGLLCESGAGVVSNCTLTGNSASHGGGGAYCGFLNNCRLITNSAFAYRIVAYGGGAYGCTLTNCTLTGNSAEGYGGGAYESALNNCTLTGNSAGYGGGAYDSALNQCTLTGNSAHSWRGSCGGAAEGGTLSNCTLTGNCADVSGGGVSGGTLIGCTLTGNSAFFDGGADGGRLNNCIVYYNVAVSGPNNYGYLSTLNYCCTTPLPESWQGGTGNITLKPLFVDRAGGNLRLQTNSPCINAGNNAYVTNSTDLDGNPRIVGGTVDIGAYEFQAPSSGISYAWLQQYGLPTDGSADATDPDADGLNNCQEWHCATDPTNALSVLRLLSASPAGSNATVTWQSVAGVSYFLERSTDLSATPPFTPLATNVLGPTGTNSFTDTNATSAPRLFYRVGVP